MSNIKLETTKLENFYKRNELNNKSKTVNNEILSYRNQYILYNKNVKNYEQLWQAEKALFELGESSLFLINSREMSYINSQLKLNEIIAKIKKSIIEQSFILGNLYNLK